MTAAPLLVVAIRGQLGGQARLVGLALSQALQLGRNVQWMARQGVEAENYLTSGALFVQRSCLCIVVGRVDVRECRGWLRRTARPRVRS